MARFSILFVFMFAVVSLSAAAAQAQRPMYPQPRPQANTNQPNPQQQTLPQQQQQPAGNTMPGNPQVAPIKPSPNVPMQAGAPANVPPATPVTPPVVTYRDGLLTVQATNSTLSSVLNAIRNKSGIEFEGLENATDRVVLSIGPAPAGEVLASILAGSKFGFVAIGRSDDPSIVQRVILSPKTQPGGAVAVQQQPPRPNDNGEGGDPDETPDEQVNVEPQ